MCQDHDDDHDDDDGEYWGEIPESDSCFMCGDDGEDVHSSDRWNFQTSEEDGTDVENFWLCRTCHSQFETVEEFDKFRQNWKAIRLYNSCASLQRVLLKEAPETIIALHIKTIFFHAIRDQGKLGKAFLAELKRSNPDSYETEEN